MARLLNELVSHSNITSTTAAFSLHGGLYGITVNATWGGGSVTLQRLAGDGTTYITCLTAFTADGYATVPLPPGTYKVVVATATGVYVTIAALAASAKWSGGDTAPSIAIALSVSSVAEDASSGTLIGTLSVVGSYTGTPVFALDDDAGGAVALDGDDVEVAAALDHETAPTLAIIVSVSGITPAVSQRAFNINVTDVAEGGAGDAWLAPNTDYWLAPNGDRWLIPA
jgi:hypothetical protein